MQEQQHNKEEQALAYLKQHLNHTFIDVHNDYSTGIDFYYEGKPYDLKASKSNKLTVFKLYKGKWYSPLLNHMEVPYAYTRYVDQQITHLLVYKKTTILESLAHHTLTSYSGDGNYNINVDITDIEPDDYIIIENVNVNEETDK